MATDLTFYSWDDFDTGSYHSQIHFSVCHRCI